jgi:hypothetical protein
MRGLRRPIAMRSIQWRERGPLRELTPGLGLLQVEVDLACIRADAEVHDLNDGYAGRASYKAWLDKVIMLEVTSARLPRQLG